MSELRQMDAVRRPRYRPQTDKLCVLFGVPLVVTLAVLSVSSRQTVA